MVLSSTQTTLVALALLNSGVSLIYNPLLLYALLKGNILRSKCNHDFMTLLLLFGLIFTSFADFVIVVFLLSLGITTKDSTTLCNSSGKPYGHDLNKAKEKKSLNNFALLNSNRCNFGCWHNNVLSASLCN